MAVEKRRLGKTEIEITPIGLGCWQFAGGRGFSALFWKSMPQDEVDKIVKTALEGGINWFDTAEAYGEGESERALSKALSKAGRTGVDVVIATKWWPMYFLPGVGFPSFPRTAGNIPRTIGNRQRYLAPFKIDLYQIHRPYSFSSVEAQMDAMAALVKAGKIRSVGVSEFSVEKMRQAHAALVKHGLPLASNQVFFNLLVRRIEKNGILDAAKELGITIIAYSPLAQGLLTGKFHKNPELVKKLPFLRRRMLGRWVEKSRPLIKALEDIAGSYNCTTAEVALSWAVNFHGDTVVAIPGASKAEHVLQNIGALKLKLTQPEMTKLDELSRMIPQ
jgi:aryl-alcohol dehydrogenase-like predicted oxidoreductase